MLTLVSECETQDNGNMFYMRVKIYWNFDKMMALNFWIDHHATVQTLKAWQNSYTHLLAKYDKY